MDRTFRFEIPKRALDSAPRQMVNELVSTVRVLEGCFSGPCEAFYEEWAFDKLILGGVLRQDADAELLAPLYEIIDRDRRNHD